MKKRNLYFSIISLLIFVMAMGGISYAYFIYSNDVADVDLVSGSIHIDFQDASSLNITAQTMNDTIGKLSSNYLDFSVLGTVDEEAILYEIDLVPKVSSTIDTNYIKVYLTDQEGNEILSPFFYDELYTSDITSKKVVYQDLFKSNDGNVTNFTKNYRLRVWVDESYTSTVENVFSFSVYLYAQNVNATNLEKVTFNLQEEREHGPVKYVMKGQEYGNLPILRNRDGYTFLGWNGKNLFNEHDWLLAISGATYKNGYYVFSNTSAYILYGKDVSQLPLYDFKENTQYTYTINGYVADNRLTFYLVGGGKAALAFNSTEPTEVVYTTLENTTITRARLSYGSNATVYISHIQLEEGAESTAFEPYFVDGSVLVTQNANHELRGIWEWNNYYFNDVIQQSNGWMSPHRYRDCISSFGDRKFATYSQVNDLSTVSLQVTTQINALNTGSNSENILSNINSGGSALYLSPSNEIKFTVYLTGYDYVTVASQNTVDTTSVHNYAGVYDGDYLRLYIDGVLDNTLDVRDIISNNSLTGAIGNPTNNTPMVIGCNPKGTSCDSDSFYTGDVYSARVYDYAITENKIWDNMQKDGLVS